MVLCRVEAQRILNPAQLLNAIAFAVGSVHRVEGEIGILSPNLLRELAEIDADLKVLTDRILTMIAGLSA